MVGLAAKRPVVESVVKDHGITVKRAGRGQLVVSGYHCHFHGRRDDAPVGAALRRLSARRLLVLLGREGFKDNHKRINTWVCR